MDNVTMYPVPVGRETPNDRLPMEDFEIEITQEDIDEGVCGNAMQCPVARSLYRAVRERYGPQMEAHVTHRYIDIIAAPADPLEPLEPGDRSVYHTDMELRRWIERFDMYEKSKSNGRIIPKVKPITILFQMNDERDIRFGKTLIISEGEEDDTAEL